MAPKVYMTGATGYIGGDALVAIIDKHPDWGITCQVRNSDKGAKIASRFAHVRLVYGDLDALDLIEEEASKADIVYHFANNDHEASAHAIARGLARRVSQSPSFWIHTSGTMILALQSIDNKEFGEKFDKVFDDWNGVMELVNMPEHAPHRAVDKIVLDASATNTNIRTAIVCPPTIYGRGRGPDNQRSHQIYEATEMFLTTQKAIVIGKGQNMGGEIHVHDLSQLYLLLGEAAAAGGSPATWNEQGYYLAENGEFAWIDVLQEVANIAHKKNMLPSSEIHHLSVEEKTALGIDRPLEYSIGTDMRGTSLRGKKLLSWVPKERRLRDEIPEIVDSEARRLALVKGHAARVEEITR